MSTVATISLRPAALTDAEVIFGWRNRPLIVRLGSSQRQVSWEEHVQWLTESLASERHRLFIIQWEEVAIGQVRFHRWQSSECVISVYLAPEFTGNGWGVEAIRQACDLIFESWTVNSVVACVRAENHGAQAAFRKAGFEAEENRCGAGHFSFLLHRSAKP